MSSPVLGFIGTGTISSALVRGFMRVGFTGRIVVSPRNAGKAAQLKKEFPSAVTVAESNQAVADAAEVVFVAVLPEAAEGVYTSLRFRKEQTIINLVRGCGLDTLEKWTGGVKNLAHIIPMAFTAEVNGPIVLYPENAFVRALLSPIGEIVAVDSPEKAATLQQITGLGASFDTMFRDVVLWGIQEGLSEEASIAYCAAFFAALARQEAKGTLDRVRALAEEFTPGGLNWKGKTTIEAADGFSLWTAALDAIKEHSLS